MMTHPTLKVLVAYHRRSMVVRDDVYAPILAGAAVTSMKSKDGRVFLEEDFLSGMLYRDDDGENISSMNRTLNEMSVVYWAWKNYAKLGNPAHIGLAHYRRFFIADESLPLPRHRWYPNSEMYLYGDEAAFRAAISSDRLADQLASADVISTYRYSASSLKGGRGLRNCRDRFVQMMGEEKGFLYDEMERMALAARPELKAEAEYMRGHTDHHVCNMFVLPRDEFFRYCEFVFPILFRLAEMNAAETDVELMRAPGFLAEFLTSMHLAQLVREGRLRVKPLRIACWGIPAHGLLRKIGRRILPDRIRHALKKSLGVS